MRLTTRFLTTALFLCLVTTTFAETVTGKVVSIADGDTVTVLQNKEQIKVRLHGVDTPEKSQDFGQAAKAFTADLCFGDVVTVHVTDTDRYGRKVGLVILDGGRVLNHELVAAGMAHWYKQYAPDDLALKHLHAEAKAAKRGLWSRPDVITPSDFRQGERNGNAEPYNPPGTEADLSRDSAATTPGTVFITDSGAKYHREDCRFLKKSKQAMALEKARKRYEPCGVCKP